MFARRLRNDRFGPLARAAIGRRSDWAVARPRLRRPDALGWVGPVAVAASTLAGWWAFAGATGDGPVALGLFVGAASIVLMAWSFVLAVRIRLLEPLFGGLDRMYQVHRWAGVLAMGLMFLHTRIEPEIDGGIAGASRSVAETAEELAGTGEVALYALVALSLLRWFPYRWWRLTHKLTGIPFAVASWHVVTAEKTFANGSPWGWYFGAIMGAGLVAYVYRVVWLDMVRRGRTYEVVAADVHGRTLELELAPRGRGIDHRAGQFAVLKLQRPGLGEPHPFTISSGPGASGPGAGRLRFVIRDLGDWSGRLIAEGDGLVGTTVLVEGPYGTFQPGGRPGQRVVWIAGGVGITPFLAAIDELEPTGPAHRPILVSCVRSGEDAPAVERLRRAADDGRIELHLVASAEGRRFSERTLRDILGQRDLTDAHVAVCGPTGLVRSAERAAHRLGARAVETEVFDIRSGIGPDLSKAIDGALDGPRTKDGPPGRTVTPEPGAVDGRLVSTGS